MTTAVHGYYGTPGHRSLKPDSTVRCPANFRFISTKSVSFRVHILHYGVICDMPVTVARTVDCAFSIEDSSWLNVN